MTAALPTWEGLLTAGLLGFMIVFVFWVLRTFEFGQTNYIQTKKVEHMKVSELMLATGCASRKNAKLWLPHLEFAMRTYGISTPGRRAFFLANIGHESGGLQYTQEIWGPTEAQSRYENREDLGNRERGDGKRYRGRGLLQITGRYNYEDITARLKAHLEDTPDFVADPDAMRDPRWAALSAADFWNSRGLNLKADVGTDEAFRRAVKLVNGGLNGLDDRLRLLAAARAALGVTHETDSLDI